MAIFKRILTAALFVFFLPVLILTEIVMPDPPDTTKGDHE